MSRHHQYGIKKFLFTNKIDLIIRGSPRFSLRFLRLLEQWFCDCDVIDMASTLQALDLIAMNCINIGHIAVSVVVLFTHIQCNLDNQFGCLLLKGTPDGRTFVIR